MNYDVDFAYRRPDGCAGWIGYTRCAEMPVARVTLHCHGCDRIVEFHCCGSCTERAMNWTPRCSKTRWHEISTGEPVRI